MPWVEGDLAPPALLCFVSDVLRGLPPIGVPPGTLAAQLAKEGAIGAGDFVGSTVGDLAGIWPSLRDLPAEVVARFHSCAPEWAKRPTVEVAVAAAQGAPKRARLVPPALDEPITLRLLRESISVFILARETRRRALRT